MIRSLFILSWLSFCYAAEVPLSRNNAGFIAEDSLKQVSNRLTASIRQLHSTDVIRLFPQIMKVCPTAAFTVPCIPPVGAWDHNRLSSQFGWRIHPIQGRYKHHKGIDIAGPHQLVRSAASGTVTRASYERGLGLSVLIDHGNSYQTIYGHLALITCLVGQKIQIGQQLGILGQTGQATGLHLHYAVLKSGQYLNPNDYLTVGLKFVINHHLANP